MLKQLKKCFNCFGEGHSGSQCTHGSCRTCNGKHHTLLHKNSEQASVINQSDVTPGASKSNGAAVVGSQQAPKPARNHHSKDATGPNQSMLATAIVKVVDSFGNSQRCRALLDGGSTATFITTACTQRLGLRKLKSDVAITGLSSASVGTAKYSVSFSFSPHYSTEVSYTVDALVLTKVTESLPTYSCDTTGWSHLKNIQLADPAFHKPAAIDILLGSDVFWELLKGDRKHGPPGSPLGISSTIGWLVAGSHNPQSNRQSVRAHFATPTIESQLQAFWELEAIPSRKLHTAEESECESHFVGHHSRDSDGRFTVHNPFRSPKPALGSSKNRALQCLKALERRFQRDSTHLKEYQDFMQDYISLGHMSLVTDEEIANPRNPTYYIPHHFVLKEESTTTKLRVVFNAAAQTDNGLSLNDIMLVGPKLQDDLVDIIMRFRIHPIAFTADIAKMYRQIKVSSADADLQRILWRENPTDEIKEYRLNTVTYGTASAPYLAVKVLHQLADDEASSLPLAQNVTKKDFYVDDLMTSVPTLDMALSVQSELLQLMDRGCLSLRKWVSNSAGVLNALPEELRETKFLSDVNLEPSVKALGIRWNTKQDRFEFRYSSIASSSTKLTKRIILSEMSKLFDPLGWLSPVIISAKILMQTLWKIQTGWDEGVPHEIEQYWINFKKDLKSVDLITIPRCLIPSTPKQLQLAGFCDASEKAYGAVVYLCAYGSDGSHISLLGSKTRVAPTKQISLPRLELCGALLLSDLMESIQEALDLPITDTKAWTDSTIVLAWLKSHPSRWKTFVANRIAAIQDQLPFEVWSHIPGTENPADCCSRGLNLSELANFPLWWNGPKFLHDRINCSDIPEPDENISRIMTKEERKQSVPVFHGIPIDFTLLDKFSSLTKLVRITAWIYRFYSLTRKDVKQRGPLTPAELEVALRCWIRLVQKQEFSPELKALGNEKEISSKSKLLSLNPFLDNDGLMRVGGRIRNANVCNDQKTPFLLPRNSKLTQLIIQDCHLKNLHAGPTLLLNILGQKYWILRARDAVRFYVKKCVVCRRQSAIMQQQFMSDLPLSRVTPCRAFKRVGVDFAGPFSLRPDLPRNKSTIKSYLCLFVCFTTRAFHLEVVSSLSTDAFIASLRRFTSRRGRPTDIYSDCGTNFVGANRELKDLEKLVTSKNHNFQVADETSKNGITWHFNPPGAPHFGGLWEAGVKSVKYHLHRILGTQRLTFEEFTTFMTQIEACLNSRPLSPMSSDPSDLTALTSGHFLIHEPLLAIPEPDLTHENQNRLSRWQLLQSFQQQFWKRWSTEFLARLQQRPKWLKHRTDLKLDDMVIIKDENLPPQMWKLGRIISLHPGADQLVRVVTIRTQSGEIKRPIHKLCLLPIMDSEEKERSADLL